jgi:hypothetical protein
MSKFRSTVPVWVLPGNGPASSNSAIVGMDRRRANSKRTVPAPMNKPEGGYGA